MIKEAITARQASMRSALQSNFSQTEETVQKGISQEEFDKSYGEGHEVFTAEAISKFKADCLEKGEDASAISEELDTLKEVLVIKGEATEAFFVKKEVSYELWDTLGEEDLI